MTDAQKRQYVANLYRGKGWKRRVEKMSEDRITAIYLSHQRDGSRPAHTETEEEPHLDLPKAALQPVQTHPHQNEDDFPIY